MSNPNGCPGPRPWRLLPSSQKRGSADVNTFGTAAIAKNTSSSRLHSTNCGLRSNARRSSRFDSVRPSPSSWASALTTAVTSDMTHPRIQDSVEEIHQQVDHDEREEGQRRQQHHDPALLQLDRLEHELAQPGQVEDRLGDDRAAE